MAAVVAWRGVYGAEPSDRQSLRLIGGLMSGQSRLSFVGLASGQLPLSTGGLTPHVTPHVTGEIACCAACLLAIPDRR